MVYHGPDFQCHLFPNAAGCVRLATTLTSRLRFLQRVVVGDDHDPDKHLPQSAPGAGAKAGSKLALALGNTRKLLRATGVLRKVVRGLQHLSDEDASVTACQTAVARYSLEWGGMTSDDVFDLDQDALARWASFVGNFSEALTQRDAAFHQIYVTENSITDEKGLDEHLRVVNSSLLVANMVFCALRARNFPLRVSHTATLSAGPVAVATESKEDIPEFLLAHKLSVALPPAAAGSASGSESEWKGPPPAVSFLDFVKAVQTLASPSALSPFRQVGGAPAGLASVVRRVISQKTLIKLRRLRGGGSKKAAESQSAGTSSNLTLRSRHFGPSFKAGSLIMGLLACGHGCISLEEVKLFCNAGQANNRDRLVVPMGSTAHEVEALLRRREGGDTMLASLIRLPNFDAWHNCLMRPEFVAELAKVLQERALAVSQSRRQRHTRAPVEARDSFITFATNFYRVVKSSVEPALDEESERAESKFLLGHHPLQSRAWLVHAVSIWRTALLLLSMVPHTDDAEVIAWLVDTSLPEGFVMGINGAPPKVSPGHHTPLLRFDQLLILRHEVWKQACGLRQFAFALQVDRHGIDNDKYRGGYLSNVAGGKPARPKTANAAAAAAASDVSDFLSQWIHTHRLASKKLRSKSKGTMPPLKRMLLWKLGQQRYALIAFGRALQGQLMTASSARAARLSGVQIRGAKGDFETGVTSWRMVAAAVAAQASSVGPAPGAPTLLLPTLLVQMLRCGQGLKAIVGASGRQLEQQVQVWRVFLSQLSAKAEADDQLLKQVINAVSLEDGTVELAHIMEDAPEESGDTTDDENPFSLRQYVQLLNTIF